MIWMICFRIMEENRYHNLREQGWIKQSILDEPRLSECVELYKSLGYEVLLEPVRPEYLQQECAQCLCADTDKYKVIFTREKQSDGL